MIRVERLAPIVVLYDTLVTVGAELMCLGHSEVLPLSTLIYREQDSIGVARRALLLARVIDFTVLVIFERWQEIDLILTEPPHQFITILVR